MARTSRAAHSRRWPRQGAAEGGRSRARSIAPVVVLGTCMIAVLYGNATYYSDRFRQNHPAEKASASHSTSAAGGRQSVWTPGGSAKEPSPAEGGDARGDGDGDAAADAAPDTAASPGAQHPASSESSKKPLAAAEEELPEAPELATKDGGHGDEIVQVEVEGGVQDRWDDDGGGREGEESQEGNGVGSLTIGGANVEVLGEGAGLEGAGGAEGEGDGDGDESPVPSLPQGPEDVAGVAVEAGGAPEQQEEPANRDGTSRGASPGSGVMEEGDVPGQGASERDGGDGSISGSVAGEDGAGGVQERSDGSSVAGEGEGEEEGGLAGLAASRSGDSASGMASASEGAAGSGAGGEGGVGGEGGLEGAADAEVEGLPSNGGGEGIAASFSLTATSKAPADAQEEQPRQEQQEQEQTPDGGVPEGLLQPSDEQGQQEQQEQEPVVEYDAPAGSAPEGLLQPGDESVQQEQQEQKPMVEYDAPAGDAPEGSLQPSDEQGQQEQGPPLESGASAGDAPEGLLQPGDAQGQQEQQEQEETSENHVPQGGAPEGLLQPGDEQGQQEQQEQEETSENHVPEGDAPGVLQPSDEQGQQEQQEQEETSENHAHAGDAPESLSRPGDEQGQHEQQEEQQQEQELTLENHAPEGDAPEGLFQPGEEQGQQEQGQQEQQELTSENSAPDRAPEGLLQPGEGADAKKEDSTPEGLHAQLQELQQDQAPEYAAPQALLQPGDAGAEGGAQGNSGAVQGSMQCATTRLGEGVDNIVNIATWKDVPGDAEYRHPLAEENAGRYVTLQKDLGGFNNIRLSLETGVAFAAATGRTFVIPPPFTIWNMNAKDPKKEVDLRDLFSFDKLRESGRVSVITTEEFLEREALTGQLGVQPGEAVKNLDVQAVASYLEDVARQYKSGLPELKVEKSAFVMPRHLEGRVDLQDESYAFAKKWLYGRELLEYRETWQQAKLIHWRAFQARLLTPFYAFVLHADEVADRYHKRLLRDLMHYPEEVYCKASQIISLLRQEDPSGEFSTFHVRRNDFGKSYKVVDLPMAEVIQNSVDHLKDNEVVYVATDEKNLSLFEPFHKYVRVRFMSDYYERAGVSELNPNLLGMVDQVIASHGRTFTGCWLSTFTAYIVRLRGHLQKPRTSNWSYYKPKATYHHEYRLPENPLWMTEWPLGWEGIDDTGVPAATAARQ